MKGSTLLKGFTLLVCLLLMSVPNVFALSYEFDFNGDGVFENTWALPSVGSTVQVDIWLDGYTCSPSDLLFGAQLYFNYNHSVVQVNGGYPNDTAHGGPFDPGLSGFVQQEPGVYLLSASHFNFVTVTGNKIKIGTVELERIASGTSQIIAANDLGFGGYDDGFVADCNLSSLYPSDAVATLTQMPLSYKFDFNGDGVFENTWALPSVGSTVQVDIWLDGYTCSPSNLLFGAQLYFNYNHSVVQVNGGYPNDTAHGGPFDPGLSGFVQQEPGVYLLSASHFNFVTVTGNKIKIGTVELERIASGTSQIIAANDLGFGGYDDGFVADCNLSSLYPSDAVASISQSTTTTTITGDFCKGLADYDQDVDAEDLTTFLENFGRGQYSNPCPPDGPARVTKTGQTTSYYPTDDGDLEPGVEWPNPRFSDYGDTVIDNLTGLMWMKNANLCSGSAPWEDAFTCVFFANMSGGTYGYNDWRIPSANEIHSLLDYGQSSPALPVGHPFQNVGSPTDPAYWTSTTSDYNTADAFVCSVNKDHNLVARSKTSYYRVWLVRGGHN